MHTSLRAFYKSRFPSWTVAVVVNGGSCSSLQSTGSYFFSSHCHSIFPSSQSSGGVCGQLALPQSCWGFLGLPGWGQAPSVGPSHLAQKASRPDLGSWETHFFFSSREKHVSLYHPISGEGCEVTLEDGAHAICSSRLSPGEVPQTHRDLFIFHFGKKKKKECACYLFQKMNAEIMFHSAPFQNTSWNHKSWPR